MYILLCVASKHSLLTSLVSVGLDFCREKYHNFLYKLLPAVNIIASKLFFILSHSDDKRI
jgi:hypothetical protein